MNSSKVCLLSLDSSEEYLKKVISGIIDFSKTRNTFKLVNKYYSTLLEFQYCSNEFEKCEALILCLSDESYNPDKFFPLFSKSQQFDIPLKILIVKNLEQLAPKDVEHVISTFSDNEFEIIEFEPINPENSYDYQPDDYGISRLKDSLSTNNWNAAIFHIKPLLSNKCEIQIIDEVNHTPSPNNDEIGLSGDESQCEDFDILFNKLTHMKESLKQLSPEKRVQLAKEMTTHFWNSIDGDEEELADIFASVRIPKTN